MREINKKFLRNIQHCHPSRDPTYCFLSQKIGLEDQMGYSAFTKKLEINVIDLCEVS